MKYTYSAAGKGSDPRPVDYKQFTTHFDEIINMGKNTRGAKLDRLQQEQNQATDIVNSSEQKPQ